VVIEVMPRCDWGSCTRPAVTVLELSGLLRHILHPLPLCDAHYVLLQTYRARFAGEQAAEEA